MIPTTWLSVVLFVLFVAPGLLFDLLADKRRATGPQSPFREASRVVLASLAFTSVGIAVVSLVRVIHASWMPDPRQMLGGTREYLIEHLGALLWAGALELAVALGCAWGFHQVLVVRHGAPLRQVSAWKAVFRDDVPVPTVGVAPAPIADVAVTILVRVKLLNGTVFTGQVAHYTADLELPVREIVLGPPLFSKTGSNPLTALSTDWSRLILAGSSIESIAVQYQLPQP